MHDWTALCEIFSPNCQNSMKIRNRFGLKNCFKFVFHKADSAAGQRLHQGPVATALTTPYQSLLSTSPQTLNCHCSALTPVSPSDISRVKVRTSNTYPDTNKWQLNVTLGPEAKTMRWNNMVSLHRLCLSVTIIVYEKLDLWNNDIKPSIKG